VASSNCQGRDQDEYEKIKRIFHKQNMARGKSVKIDCYISQGCGSEKALKENITRALEAEKIHAEVGIHRINDEKAAELKLSGSPSVFIDGKELQPQGIVGFS
jgi:hypothetical protein